jgi:hypothetical protein
VEGVGEVAAKLVRAYAELRQLDFLLASLTASLQTAADRGAAVIRSRAFQDALQQASSCNQQCLDAVFRPHICQCHKL